MFEGLTTFQWVFGIGGLAVVAIGDLIMLGFCVWVGYLHVASRLWPREGSCIDPVDPVPEPKPRPGRE